MSVSASNVAAPGVWLLVIVNASPAALVVIPIPVPATTAKVSVFESASMFGCPVTVIILNAF